MLNRAELADQLGLMNINERRPLLNYLLEQKQTTNPSIAQGDNTAVNPSNVDTLKEKAQVEFAHYDHGQFNRIHIGIIGFRKNIFTQKLKDVSLTNVILV